MLKLFRSWFDKNPEPETEFKFIKVQAVVRRVDANCNPEADINDIENQLRTKRVTLDLKRWGIDSFLSNLHHAFAKETLSFRNEAVAPNVFFCGGGVAEGAVLHENPGTAMAKATLTRRETIKSAFKTMAREHEENELGSILEICVSDANRCAQIFDESRQFRPGSQE